MPTTQGPSESSMGTPMGAVPQPPPGLPDDGDPHADPDPSRSLRLSARSGDTAVVFRLSRDVPFLHRLGERAADRLERLLENPRMVIAGAISLLTIGALALMIGDAYRSPTPVSPPTPARAPVVLPLPPPAAPRVAAPAPVLAAPAVPFEVAPAVEPQRPRPVRRPRKPRASVAAPVPAPAKQPAAKAPASHPAARPATAPARW